MIFFEQSIPEAQQIFTRCWGICSWQLTRDQSFYSTPQSPFAILDDMTSSLNSLETFSRGAVVTISKPLIPFLEAPWSSRSRYPAILVRRPPTIAAFSVHLTDFYRSWRYSSMVRSMACEMSAENADLPQLAGVSIVLFGWTAFTLIRQRAARRAVLVASCLLFTLETADVILTNYFFFNFVLKVPPVSSKDDGWNRFLEAKFAVYVVAKYVACSGPFF